MLKFFIGVFLFLLAWALFLPLSLLNYLVVLCKGKAKGYFYSSAVSIDQFANRELRTLWNGLLRKPNGYSFGDARETISSALGKNQRDGSLSFIGKVLCWIFDKLDKNHCQKNIKKL